MPYSAATFVGKSGWTIPTGEPACWSWDEPDEFDWSNPWATLREWQAGRCALCGSSDRRLVTDHSHDDGKARGELCASCNTHEGHCWNRRCPCVGYRFCPPARILGVTVNYPGLHAPATEGVAMPDPIAAAYSAAASAANGGTLAARPGSVGNVAGEDVAPMSDVEFADRLGALRDVMDSALVGLSTLRDADAAERLGVRSQLEAVVSGVRLMAVDLDMLRTHLDD